MSEASGLTWRYDADGVLRVVFDTPGEKVNLLNEALLTELAELMDEASRRDDVRGVLFSSAKPRMFIAGMDVEQIAAVTDSHQGAEGARQGQAVFQKIDDLTCPTVCAIGGPCLGGGTEMALACTFRVASDSSAVRIGLPEVRLGIIPGFGGTQRLPRQVGLVKALDLILTGRTLDGKRARRIGLVDRVVPAAYLEREALALLRRADRDGIDSVRRSVNRKRPAAQRFMEQVTPLRRLVIDQARKRTARKARREDYPAPFRALEAIEAAMSQPLAQGLDFEARLVGELVPTPTSKNLIWLFKSQTALKADSGGTAPPRPVRRTAVLGAGIMGGGIAQLVADRDLPVRLKDLRYDAVLTALRTARQVWDGKKKRRRISEHDVQRKMANIAPTLDDTGLRHVDLVLEAVVEDLSIKRRVLADTERRIPERAVFASNTSSLPISEIAAQALRPERVVGLHFFNPVHRMPLVEIIAGRLSSPEAVATAHAFAIKLGKTPVVVQDGPGFLVNRILTFYMNEAMRLLAEGSRIDAIDGSMTAFGMPMGPFALLDQIGLDTARHVSHVIGSAFGERAQGDAAVVEAMVGDERLGRKNGRGFYKYRGGKRLAPDGQVYELVGAKPSLDLPPETLQERMVLAMVNEAVLCLQEQVVRHARDVDVAMVMGTGFPPFRGGLLRHADSVGIPIVADRLARLADAHGTRFQPAAMLHEMVRGQRRFYAG